MIRSTRHHVLDCNLGKNDRYLKFINEYSRVALGILDQMWEMLPEDLKLPKYWDYKIFDIDTNLSARVLSSIVTQVSGIIRGVVSKQKKRLWVQKHINPSVEDVAFSKPKMNFVPAQLSSKCCDFQKSSGKFYGFIRLKSLGEGFEEIIIPIIRHPRINGNLKGGFLFNKRNVQLSWETEVTPKPQGSKIIGVDQGLKTVATFSDRQTTPKTCPHGHSLESIIDSICLKKKGSKAFERKQKHRQNFINFSINRLDFSGIQELRLEKIKNMGFRKKTSRKLSHWSNPEIRDKIISKCEELEVPIVFQSSPYRSQRCSSCGLVRKSNRKGKIYKCECGFESDSDLNASLNHEADLPMIPYSFRGLKLNTKGFFWKPEGLFDLSGSELRVPNDQKG